MSDMVLELVKIAVMLSAIIAARYIIPWIKDKMSADQLALVTRWVKSAVLYAQQTMWAETGAERKEAVLKILWELLAYKDIHITEEQLNVLIEAAVKEMKISENAGVVIQGSGVEVEECEMPDKLGEGSQVNQNGIPPCTSIPQVAEA